MNFQFWLENHTPTGQRSLEDVIGIIGHQLRALGHRALWDKENRNLFITKQMGYLVVVEGFTPNMIPFFKQKHEEGVRFICVATEEPTPDGFNWGLDGEMRKRQENFHLVAPYLDGIVCLVPGKHVTDWYGQWAPTAYTELGYAPSLVRQQRARPTHDFGFYGSLSKRRFKLLRKLATACNGSIKLMTDFRTQEERDVSMQGAKVLLQIRKEEKMGLVSSSRCNTALCIGRPIVAEPHDLSKPWDEIVRFSRTTEAFIDHALMLRSAWQGIHADQFAKFKAALPPEACIGKALQEIGVFKPGTMAA